MISKIESFQIDFTNTDTVNQSTSTLNCLILKKNNLKKRIEQYYGGGKLKDYPTTSTFNLLKK